MTGGEDRCQPRPLSDACVPAPIARRRSSPDRAPTSPSRSASRYSATASPARPSRSASRPSAEVRAGADPVARVGHERAIEARACGAEIAEGEAARNRVPAATGHLRRARAVSCRRRSDAGPPRAAGERRRPARRGGPSCRPRARTAGCAGRPPASPRAPAGRRRSAVRGCRGARGRVGLHAATRSDTMPPPR